MKLTGTNSLDISLTSLDSRAAEAVLGKTADIEVTVIHEGRSLSNAELREVWNHRSNRGSRTVVVAYSAGENTTLYGPVTDRQPLTLKSQTAERLLQRFLDEPSILDASRELIGFYDSHGTSELGGVKNKGLFASHHLRENLPQRRDWAELTKRGDSLAKLRHRELVSALGFEIDSEERNALVLKTGSTEKRVIAILLEDSEKFDASSARFPSSPVSWGLSIAADHNVPWLIVMRKDQIRLHPGKDGVGVGQKGQVETYFELNLAQVDEQNIALLPLIFSAASLADKGEVQKLLEESSKFAASLGARLRERVYEQVVPPISIAVAKTLQARGEALDSTGLQRAYSMTLKILFRLLFQAYAEDRGLLPAGRNEGYDANSLKELGKRHMNTPADEFGESASIWFDLIQVWDAIDVGNKSWNVPAYNGGLFGADPEKHPEGAAIKYLELPDSVLGPALQGLLVDNTEDGVRGPVDFRSLSVREFGTIYEGLLESSLSLAEVDLTVDKSNAWVPAEAGDEILAKAGEPYFHSASGERKATGSYFTPKFVVDHLVQKAIDPTISVHLDKIAGLLRAGDTATAGREFFDFRVADLAMGSAHFLVAAVDRIEAKMRAFLSKPNNAVPAVTDELARLRKAATEALGGDEIAVAEIEDFALLRRQIARRCVYGFDINYMAVELARLALWIHTFVPGLPMSTLDHNLVHGNSLTGIGSIEEALDALVPRRNGSSTLFDDAIISGLNRAKEFLVDFAAASEADKGEVADAAALAKKAKTASLDAKYAFDAAIAARLGLVQAATFATFDQIVEAGRQNEVRELIATLQAAHMPQLFPEVFLRQNPGFDALIGNPPWEEVNLDEDSFWNRFGNQLNSLKATERIAMIEQLREKHPSRYLDFLGEKQRLQGARLALNHLKFDGQSGDIDLYQLFARRNLEALRNFGSVGLVLPRSAFVSLGSKQLRVFLLKNFNSTAFTLKNTKKWVFDGVGDQYSFVLISAERGDGSGTFGFTREIRNYESLIQSQVIVASQAELESISRSLMIPSVGSQTELGILVKLRAHPRLDSWPSWCRVALVSELHGTKDIKSLQSKLSTGENSIPIYGGKSFDLWEPSTGEQFAEIDLHAVTRHLRDKHANQIASKSSAFFGDVAGQVLDFKKRRIAFRDITRATDKRTMICAMVPENVVLVNSAPYIRPVHSKDWTYSYLLGALSSIPFDWQAKRFVELHMNFHILKDLSVPVPVEGNALQLRVAELAASEQSSSDSYTSGALAEIDALMALLYGLTASDLREVYSEFPKYKPRLERVLEYYAKWKDQAGA